MITAPRDTINIVNVSHKRAMPRWAVLVSVAPGMSVVGVLTIFSVQSCVTVASGPELTLDEGTAPPLDEGMAPPQ